MDLPLILVQLLIVIVFILRFFIFGRILGREDLIPFLADMRFRIGLWWKTILLPLTVIMVFFLAWIQLNSAATGHAPAPAFYESVSVLIGENLVLAPVSEEIIQCLFLSFVFVAVARLTSSRWKIVLANGLSLVGISLLFAAGHGDFRPVSLLLITSLFITYGALYFIADRNILPAVIAHAAWNFLAVLPVP